MLETAPGSVGVPVDLVPGVAHALKKLVSLQNGGLPGPVSLARPGCSSRGSIPILKTRKGGLQECRFPGSRSLKRDLSPT